MSLNQQLNTPYYIIDTSRIKDAYTSLFNAFESFGINGILAYSIKANYDKEIIKLLNKMGCMFEVCSVYEYQLLMNYGITPNNIIINGYIDNKYGLTDDSLIIIGNKHNVDYICSLPNDNKKIGLRLNLDYIKESKEHFFSKISRFGIPPKDWDYVINILSEHQISISCIQAHLSGNSRNPLIYSIIVKELNNFITKYHLINSVELIDIGGGFKISEKFWNFNDYMHCISHAISDTNLMHKKLIVELGNSIVRDSCIYYTKVIDTYSIEKRKYVLIDGSALHLYGTGKKIKFDYQIESLNPYSIEPETQYIVGNTCKESDCIMELKNVQKIFTGDIIKIYNVGAYTINNIPSFILSKPNVIII